MSTLNPAALEELSGDLRKLIDDLQEQIDAARQASKPVDLDEPFGRLSRMDAMQQQQMVEANRRAAQQRLAQVQSALRRVDGDEYGECVTCGEAVGFPRLKARPETPFCMACQTRREESGR